MIDYQKKGWLKRTMTPRPCVVCGRTFLAITKAKKYCRRKCLKRAEYCRIKGIPPSPPEKKNRKCKICGNVYLTICPHQITCSPICSRKNDLNKDALKRAVRLGLEYVNLDGSLRSKGKCEICGVGIFPGRGRRSVCKSEFCVKEKRRSFSRKKRGISIDPIEKRNCRRCGNKFTTGEYSDCRRRGSVFCSENCHYLFWKEDQAKFLEFGARLHLGVVMEKVLT